VWAAYWHLFDSLTWDSQRDHVRRWSPRCSSYARSLLCDSPATRASSHKNTKFHQSEILINADRWTYKSNDEFILTNFLKNRCTNWVMWNKLATFFNMQQRHGSESENTERLSLVWKYLWFLFESPLQVSQLVLIDLLALLQLFHILGRYLQQAKLKVIITITIKDTAIIKHTQNKNTLSNMHMYIYLNFTKNMVATD